jgi:hypothetical protein
MPQADRFRQIDGRVPDVITIVTSARSLSHRLGKDNGGPIVGHGLYTSQVALGRLL